MIALSTYVGHAGVSHTYWYLTAVPDLMAVTAKRFERYTSKAGEACLTPRSPLRSPSWCRATLANISCTRGP
jgi:hypothetical protein